MKQHEKWNRSVWTAVFFVLCLTMTGCNALDDSGDAGIRGRITQVSSNDTGATYVGVIMVEGTPLENAGLASDKASVTLTTKTVLVKGDLKKNIELSDLDLLTVGTQVEIIFTGPVAESYPVQGQAKVVRISSE